MHEIDVQRGWKGREEQGCWAAGPNLVSTLNSTVKKMSLH